MTNVSTNRQLRQGRTRKFTPNDPEPVSPPPPPPPHQPDQAAHTPVPDEDEEDTPWTCPHCRVVHANDSAEVTTAAAPHGRDIGCTNCTQRCPDCRDQEFTNTFRNTGPRGNRRMVCAPCVDDHYGECDDCLRLFPNDDLDGTNTANNAVCTSCGENYGTCEDCDYVRHIDNLNNVDGDTICDDCNEARQEDEEDDEDDLIHPHDYKPDEWNLHGKGDDDATRLGVELETATATGGNVQVTAQKVLDKLNRGMGHEEFAFLKHDGSIRGGAGGFEIVTHPATLDFHKERWPAIFSPNRPDKLRSDFSKYETGMHVHVTREGLTDLTILKMMAFVNANGNREFINAVAGRTPTDWAKFGPKTAKDMKPPHSKYEAINLLHSDSVEFRIFAGTLDPEVFFRNLEFVDACTEMCKPTQTSPNDMQNPDRFMDFVAANRKRYPHLFPFCEEFSGRRLIRIPKPPRLFADLAMPDQSSAAPWQPVKMSVVLQIRPPREQRRRQKRASSTSQAPPQQHDPAVITAAYAKCKAAGDHEACAKLRAMMGSVPT